MPIEWHEKCLENNKKSLLEDEAILQIMMGKINRLRCRIEKYQRQIEEAKRKGISGFDNEKFMRNKEGE